MIASGEKSILITAPVVQARRPCRFQTRRSKWSWTAVGFVALLASIFAVAFFLHAYLLEFLSMAVLLLGRTSNGGGTAAKLCPQSDVLYPEESHAQLWKSLGRDFDDDAFMTRAVAWLGGAVRIPYVFFY